MIMLSLLFRLQTSQNTLIKIALSKDKTYYTKQLYENFNVLNIKNLYFKSAALLLKIHDVPLPRVIMLMQGLLKIINIHNAMAS